MSLRTIGCSALRPSHRSLCAFLAPGVNTLISYVPGPKRILPSDKSNAESNSSFLLSSRLPVSYHRRRSFVRFVTCDRGFDKTDPADYAALTDDFEVLKTKSRKPIERLGGYSIKGNGVAVISAVASKPSPLVLKCPVHRTCWSGEIRLFDLQSHHALHSFRIWRPLTDKVVRTDRSQRFRQWPASKRPDISYQTPVGGAPVVGLTAFTLAAGVPATGEPEIPRK
ncbi:hypothetical protein VTK73DRAFT_8670 [Phialemonium thermophilum]|uniref:Uncharacterized protein n=1 Tax=Phialemonium thermophilum TaxID=223376 RepID=A0ABR3XN16_9PEZI